MWATPSSATSPWWRLGCLFKRSGGVGAGGLQARFHGTEAAGVSGPQGSLGSSRSRQSRGAHLGGHSASGARRAASPALPVVCDTQWDRAAAAPSAGRRTSPVLQAPHTNFCPASPTSAAGSDLPSARGARRAAWVVAGASLPGGDDLATVALVLLCLGGR